MLERDLLVAIIAIGLGAFLVHAAIICRPACFDFWLVRRIESRFGRTAARNIVAIFGGLMMLLGVYVLLFPSQNDQAAHRSSDSNLSSSLGEPRNSFGTTIR